MAERGFGGDGVKILILGYGASGKAAEVLARSRGYEVEVCEDGRRGQETAAPVSEAPLFAVVSPGVPLTSPLVAECRRRGIPLKSELQFGCEELKRQGWKLLAVTGSKGKSSVVKVVADAIVMSGRQAVACGNYGLPVCEVANGLQLDGPSIQTTEQSNNHTISPWAVVEVSSFMMETTELPSDTFEAAAILNLQEDHLDRHGSVEVYHGLKRKLLGMTKHPVEADGASSDLWAGSYFDNEILAGNAAVAVELMRDAGLDEARISAAFRDFIPLPHRMNRVADIGGVRYIDDSKATSLAALEAGVKMACPGPVGVRRLPVRLGTSARCRRVRLIAGGLPKGDDPKSVLPALTERVKKVYLIGQCAEAFCVAWKGAVDCEICVTMDRAVERVKREAESGETVLLSPGTASFDQFKSFGERGEVFARLVKEKDNDK